MSPEPDLTAELDAAEEIAALMQEPGVMDAYDGWMHAFHGIPVEGCGHSGHLGPAYEVGLRRGQVERDGERQTTWEDAEFR